MRKSIIYGDYENLKLIMDQSLCHKIFMSYDVQHRLIIWEEKDDKTVNKFMIDQLVIKSNLDLISNFTDSFAFCGWN